MSARFNATSSLDSRRAEVIAQFLSDGLLLRALGFRQFKPKRNFRPSSSENSRHIIFLGITF